MCNFTWKLLHFVDFWRRFGGDERMLSPQYFFKFYLPQVDASDR